MASSIGPHGRPCEHCNGESVNYPHPDCDYCHNTGRACPGGPVRLARYDLPLSAESACGELAQRIYICQTCHTIVDAAEVKHD